MRKTPQQAKRTLMRAERRFHSLLNKTTNKFTTENNPKWWNAVNVAVKRSNSARKKMKRYKIELNAQGKTYSQAKKEMELALARSKRIGKQIRALEEQSKKLDPCSQEALKIHDEIVALLKGKDRLAGLKVERTKKIFKHLTTK